MIKDSPHKGLRAFFETGSKKGIQADHARKLSRQLARLDEAAVAEDMDVAGWQLHELKDDLKGHWAASVSGNWRLTIRFEQGDAILVDYQDYH